MARVTIEDCIDKLPNRFELVLLSAHRARMISQGAPITLDRDNDKDPVVSLREIADETINKDDLREEFIHAMQKHVEVDEPEPTEMPLLTSGVAGTVGARVGGGALVGAARGISRLATGKAFSSATSNTPDGPGGPPAWARKMRRQQAMSHGVSAALHAVRSGDHGGGSTSVNLKEDR